MANRTLMVRGDLLVKKGMKEGETAYGLWVYGDPEGNQEGVCHFKIVQVHTTIVTDRLKDYEILVLGRPNKLIFVTRVFDERIEIKKNMEEPLADSESNYTIDAVKMKYKTIDRIVVVTHNVHNLGDTFINVANVESMIPKNCELKKGDLLISDKNASDNGPNDGLWVISDPNGGVCDFLEVSVQMPKTDGSSAYIDTITNEIEDEVVHLFRMHVELGDQVVKIKSWKIEKIQSSKISATLYECKYKHSPNDCTLQIQQGNRKFRRIGAVELHLVKPEDILHQLYANPAVLSAHSVVLQPLEKPRFKQDYPKSDEIPWKPNPNSLLGPTMESALGFFSKRKKPIQPIQKGGGNKKNGAAHWQATARKVKIAAKKKGKAATERTVYKNSVSGELRIRKATVAKDGTRKYVFVKF